MSRAFRSLARPGFIGVLVICCAAALSAAASASRASTAVSGTPLPYTSGSSWLAVDPVGHHVFVSGGPGNSSIVVLDFAGNIAKTITGENGASGMAINTATHTLYAALNDTGEVGEIDTSTLAKTVTFSAGANTAPTGVLIAGGKLWIMGDNPVSANLDGTGLAAGTFGGSEYAASPDGKLVATANNGISPASADVFDVTTATPTLVTSAWAPNNSSNGQDITFDASGMNVLFASGAPYYVQSLAATTLEPTGQYTTGPYPIAVAASPNGGYVAGGTSSSSPDVLLFRTGHGTAIQTWSLQGSEGGSFSQLSRHGLAFSPDGSRLFAVAGGQFFSLTISAGSDTSLLINNGDYATSSPTVQLNVAWPVLAHSVRISNDAGFGSTGNTKTVPVGATIPWALSAGSSGGASRSVYVRFPDTPTPTVTLKDTIILDTTTPVVSAASRIRTGAVAGQYKVELAGSEKRSGISQVLFSTTKTGGTTVVLRNRTKPGITALSRTITVAMPTAPKWVRVRSAAGKWSAWHVIVG